RGPVVATIVRPPSLSTKTLPSSVATSTWVGSAPLRAAAPCWRSFPPASARAVPSASVEATTPPSPSTIAAARTWEEISVNSARDWAASTGANHTAPREGQETITAREVLRRPRYAPCGDDRLLRTALLRAADVPRSLAPRVVWQGRRVELPGQGAQARFPRNVGRGHRRARAQGPGQRGDARI